MGNGERGTGPPQGAPGTVWSTAEEGVALVNLSLQVSAITHLHLHCIAPELLLRSDSELNSNTPQDGDIIGLLIQSQLTIGNLAD